MNRVVTDPGECERCQARQAAQADALETLRDALPALEFWLVPDEPGDTVGLAALERISTHFTTDGTLDERRRSEG